MFQCSIGKRSLDRCLGLGAFFVLLFSQHESASAIDIKTLLDQGFHQRIVDGRSMYVNDLLEQSYDLRPDGSAKRTFFAYGPTLDADGQPTVERFARYVVVTDADDNVVKVIDQFEIPHMGADLTQTDNGVSFIDHLDREVTIRDDGSRRVVNERGKGPGFETYYSGLVRMRFNSEGKVTNRYGYGTVVQGEGAFTTKHFELNEFIAVNSRGAFEHWRKTAADAESGEQTWMLQNGKDGESVALRGVHRITVANDKSIVTEHSTLPGTPGEEQLVASKTIHNLDDARIEHKTFKKSDESIRESTAVFGNEEEPSYFVESIFTMENGEQQLSSVTVNAGGFQYTSKDGRLWVETPAKDRKSGYFLGEFKILVNGSYYQNGFETDASGERLKKEGALAPARTFLIDTSGISIEIPSAFANLLDRTRARIVRDREGDLLHTTDANGRSTSFRYSQDRDINDKRIIRTINDAAGYVWSTDDKGREWYQPETGKERDSSEIMTMQLNREAGSVTYEGWREITTVSLDGTTQIKDKDAKSARIYNGDGQIISTTDLQGDTTRFTYTPERTLIGFETDATATQPTQGEEIRIVGVNWNGEVTYLREFASNHIDRYVHSKDGTIKVFDRQDKLLSITHPSGLECVYEYQRESLRAMKRTTRNGVQLFYHDKEGNPKIVVLARDGTKTRKTESALAGFRLDEDGKLILDYGYHQEAEEPRSQTFYPDGSRRVLRQDLSTWSFDKADRLKRYRIGISGMFIVAEYIGNQYVPSQLSSPTGDWTRAEQPLREADDGALVFEWSYGLTDNSKKRKWTGPVELSGSRIQIPGEDGIYLIDIGEDWKHIFVDNNASFVKNKAGQITECSDAQDKRFIYERDSAGRVARALLVAGYGDTLKTEKVYAYSSGVAQVTINEKTGQPTFLGTDGLETIHEVNGVILTRNKEGQIVRLAAPKGKTFSVTKERQAETVSRIDYDLESGDVTMAFENGDSAWFDREGAMVVTNQDNQLVRSVDDYAGNTFEYSYDDAGELASIIQTAKSLDREDKVRVIERMGGPSRWRWKTRGEEVPGEPFERLLVDSKTGKQTRFLNNGSVVKVGPNGDADESTLDGSEVRSVVRRQAAGEVNEILDAYEHTLEFFRNKDREVILMGEGNEGARRISESYWESSYEGGKHRIAQFAFDDNGNQVWKNKDVTLTRYPDGSRRIQLTDGSETHHTVGRLESRTAHASGGDVKEAMTNTKGFKTVVFRDGVRHIQHPNEFVVRREDAQGEPIGTFMGLIRVSDFGTVTQIDLEKNTVTVYHRNGSPTKVFQRKVARDGAEIQYFDGRQRVDLRDFDAKEPRSIGPEVGFNRITGESIIWADMAYVGRPDAHTPKRRESASVAKKTEPEKTSSSKNAGHPDLAAAEKGDAVAQYKLGQHYFTQRDFAQAKVWLEKSAAQGNAGAKILLRVVDRELQKK